MKILLITVIEIVIVSVIRAAGSVINDNLIFALDIDLKILYLSSRCVNLQQRRVEIPPNATDVYYIPYCGNVFRPNCKIEFSVIHTIE